MVSPAAGQILEKADARHVERCSGSGEDRKATLEDASQSKSRYRPAAKDVAPRDSGWRSSHFQAKNQTAKVSTGILTPVSTP